MVEDRKILHIADTISSIDNGQLGYELIVDADLAFKMWGGKDADGNVTKWLAKDKAIQVTTATLTGGTTTGSDGLVRHDTNGLLSGGLILIADLNDLISDADLASILDDAYNNDIGERTVIVDDGDVSWNLAGAYSFNLNLENATGTSDGFWVNTGTGEDKDFFNILKVDIDKLNLNALLDEVVIETAGGVAFECAGAFDLNCSNIDLSASTLTIKGTTKITTEAAENLNLVPGAAGITVIGDAGSPSHLGTPTNDDAFVAGRVEIGGITNCVGELRSYNQLSIYTSTLLRGGIRAGTDDGIRFFVDSTEGRANNNFILTTQDNRSFDHDHDTLSPDPTFFGHSSTNPDTDNTQWWSLTHDQTDFLLQTGFGKIKLLPATGNITQIGDAGSTSHFLNTNDDLFVSGELEVDGLIYADLGIQSFSNIILSANAVLGGSPLGSFATFKPTATVQTPSTSLITVGSTSNHVVVCQGVDTGFDFAHAQTVDPTWFWHSANQATDEWISIAHNRTNGIIGTGLGGVEFSNAIFTGETITPTPVADYGAWYTKADNKPYFQDGAGVEHEIAINGAVQPLVAFYATRNSGSQALTTGVEAIIALPNEDYDDGSDFNVSTYKFTAPTDGYYSFSASADITTGIAGRAELRLYKNTTIIAKGDTGHQTAATIIPCVSCQIKLAATDTVEVRAYQATGFAATLQNVDLHFSGVQIGEI